MTILIYIVLALIAVLVLLRFIAEYRFRKEVNGLFAHAKLPTRQRFSYQQLEGLPDPVQRYFKHVLQDGQPYIHYIRIKHDGQFKTGLDKPWIPIKGEQYFTTQLPGFIWKGSTTFFTARDMYVAGKGRLVVSLLSFINIINAQGPQYNQGELLRWLSESIWFPTNLLPGEHIKWTPIDAHHAELAFSYNEHALRYTVTFNENNELTQMETMRYMDAKKLAPWVCKCSHYKTLNNVSVPTVNEAYWKIDGVEMCYARFNLLQIEYDVPKRF